MQSGAFDLIQPAVEQAWVSDYIRCLNLPRIWTLCFVWRWNARHFAGPPVACETSSPNQRGWRFGRRWLKVDRAQQVADQLGKSVGAVYISRSRVMQRLKVELQQFDWERIADADDTNTEGNSR